MTCTTVLCLTAALSITDGDTIREGALRVRIWGIDAPEMDTKRGPLAREHLRDLINGQPISCNLIDTDRYGRTVAQCWLPDGRDLACEMVRSGWAVDMPRYSKGAYRHCEEQ